MQQERCEAVQRPPARGTRSCKSICEQHVGEAAEGDKKPKPVKYSAMFKEKVVREALKLPEGARITTICKRYPNVTTRQVKLHTRQPTSSNECPPTRLAST